MSINDHQQIVCPCSIVGRDWAVLTLSNLHTGKTGSILKAKQHDSATTNKKFVCIQKINKPIIII